MGSSVDNLMDQNKPDNILKLVIFRACQFVSSPFFLYQSFPYLPGSVYVDKLYETSTFARAALDLVSLIFNSDVGISFSHPRNNAGTAFQANAFRVRSTSIMLRCCSPGFSQAFTSAFPSSPSVSSVFISIVVNFDF